MSTILNKYYPILLCLILIILFYITNNVIVSEHVRIISIVFIYFGIIILFRNRILKKNVLNKNAVPIHRSIAIIIIGVLALIITQNIIASFLPENKFIKIDYSILVLISYSIIIPILEEVLFRGIIFTDYIKRINLFKSVVYSSLIFSASHIFSDTGLLPVFLAGIVLSLSYYYSGKLITPILIHILINSIFLLTNSNERFFEFIFW